MALLPINFAPQVATATLPIQAKAKPNKDAKDAEKKAKKTGGSAARNGPAESMNMVRNPF